MYKCTHDKIGRVMQSFNKICLDKLGLVMLTMENNIFLIIIGENCICCMQIAPLLKKCFFKLSLKLLTVIWGKYSLSDAFIERNTRGGICPINIIQYINILTKQSKRWTLDVQESKLHDCFGLFSFNRSIYSNIKNWQAVNMQLVSTALSI